MDADGSNPTQLTDSPTGEDLPYISADGLWIYFMRVGKVAVSKVSIQGGSSEPVFGDLPAWDAVPSPDGKLLACGVTIENSTTPWSIAIISAAGGPPIKVLNIPAAFRGIKRWSRDSKSLIYINGSIGELWQQPIDGRPPTRLYTLSSERLYNFAFSPDYTKIVYSLGNEYSEAVLLSNFAGQ